MADWGRDDQPKQGGADHSGMSEGDILQRHDDIMAGAWPLAVPPWGHLTRAFFQTKMQRWRISAKESAT